MRKLILLFIAFFITLLFSCKSTKLVLYVFGASQMRTTLEKTLSLAQFDSLCAADKISNDFKKWHKSTFIDGELCLQFNLYSYIVIKSNKETVYRAIIDNDSIKISKRVKE